MSGAKGARRMYDRTTLLRIGGGPTIPDYNPAEWDLPDLVKDKSSARSIRAERSKGLIPNANHINQRTVGDDMASSSSWKVTAETPEEALITKSTSKKSRELLEQLTPDNFEELTPLFTGLPLGDNPKRMSEFIGALFELVIESPSSSSMYARMLRAICKASPKMGKTFKIVTDTIRKQCHLEFVESSTRNKKFRNLKQMLQQRKGNDQDQEFQKNSLEQEMMLSRRKGLGFATLLGDLYKMEFLTPEMMMGRVNCLKNYFNHEENLECLCALLTAIGQILEQDLGKLSEDKGNAYHDHVAAGRWDRDLELKSTWMDQVFKTLEIYQGKGVSSAELRSAISQVILLRKNGWKPKDQEEVISPNAVTDNVPLAGKETAAAATTTSPIPEVEVGGAGSIVGDLENLSLANHFRSLVPNSKAHPPLGENEVIVSSAIAAVYQKTREHGYVEAASDARILKTTLESLNDPSKETSKLFSKLMFQTWKFGLLDRTCRLGSFFLIQELYKIQMLTPIEMAAYIHFLVEFTCTLTDETVEGFCSLLTQVGEQLRKDLIGSEPDWGSKLLTRLEWLSLLDKLSPIARSSIMDLVKLFKNEWNDWSPNNVPYTSNHSTEAKANPDADLTKAYYEDVSDDEFQDCEEPAPEVSTEITSGREEHV